jgi:hypothetical protein
MLPAELSPNTSAALLMEISAKPTGFAFFSHYQM